MLSPLTKKDIPQVVRIHITQLPGFLSQLGEGFLQKYYIYSMNIPEVFTILEKKNGEILGLATGATSTEKLHIKIISHDYFGFGIEILKYFITHPKGILKIVKTISYPGLTENIPELLTIAVKSDHQKKGIGIRLFMEIAQNMKKKGSKKFLISVYDRLPANGFYKKIGCRFFKSFIFLGEKMNYYEYTIN
jgi:ribosomal protein S18 acetylase RimI-like enzyme